MHHGFMFRNRIVDIVTLSMLIAQGLKVITSLIVEKRLNFRRFLDTGSMPSSHSSSVTSLATAVGIQEGISSPSFAIAIVFACVVMFDATGVRRAAGKQAELLNKIVDNIQHKDGIRLIEGNLKELLGHTPLEVVAGAVLGVVVAFLYAWIVPL